MYEHRIPKEKEKEKGNPKFRQKNINGVHISRIVWDTMRPDLKRLNSPTRTNPADGSQKDGRKAESRTPKSDEDQIPK